MMKKDILILTCLLVMVSCSHQGKNRILTVKGNTSSDIQAMIDKAFSFLGTAQEGQLIITAGASYSLAFAVTGQ